MTEIMKKEMDFKESQITFTVEEKRQGGKTNIHVLNANIGQIQQAVCRDMLKLNTKK